MTDQFNYLATNDVLNEIDCEWIRVLYLAKDEHLQMMSVISGIDGKMVPSAKSLAYI
jgi:hypothetical protein